ncbi:indolepyruvate oxidoreductase subunit beta [Sunxiuqinia elliptica]|uniref:Indolepyruvate ferredoxin oxidoreductase beta subunit n=1 Tax=Sunxiuqinia elliptica TaxID=655355 RepID=A0A1I2GQG5_9BACT|nr:indolepyruvate oxidoreductase subunit beta [Sunxiuqinia elliptica]TDO00059.1 indolepyruvate ferredoxin oxidoreductase beta subunit [Sunxiuqinia elliptica]TDO57250.1 indolepyruvate ferredoxin oxidoreductase beta subunit [Sunxiuqinia elliptica]SFF18841.1 indolepyruvate ferredoxin oxidoreductase beta subunit [Sunxiuqinia elliptica]
MKSNIILAGVGGQGILSIAAALGTAALEDNLYIKQAETHGMSQRGGAVVSHMRISDKPIASDLIKQGTADLILSVEPMEALRYLPFLSETGYLVTNTTPFINIPNYPDYEEVMAAVKEQPRFVAIDADQMAKDAGNARSSNMVMLGAASPFIDIDFKMLEDGIRNVFGRKGEEIVEINLKALRAGREFAENNK